MRRALRFAPLLFFLAGPPAGAAAQTVSVAAGASLFLPLRDLGKATGNLVAPNGQPLQVRSGLTAAPLLTGRVEVGSPWEGVIFHGAFSSTVGARAEGEVAICGLLREEGLEEELCDTHTVDATVRLLAGGVTLARTARAGGLRPFLSLEAGAIQYAFGESGCGDEVCALQENVLEDRSDPMVHFALGFVAQAGPASLRGEVGDVVSSYRGGGELTRGETQNNLVLRALVSIPVR
ncbi:MAG: hypothetical protein KY453_03395 [Gemmatimonadetes bacterium]|nr:hypothetical protein [Gemmatimonadota bacterium]